MKQASLFDDAIPAHCRPLHTPTAPSPSSRGVGGERLARRTDSASSKTAAREVVANGTAADHAALIEAVVLKGGGWTIHEIAQATGLDNVQVARRCSTIKSIKKADDTLARKCRVSGKKLSTYWDRTTFEPAPEYPPCP